MATTLELQPEFGYVMLVTVLSIFEMMWMGINVGRARKRLDVKYPKMYSDKSDEFNCIQRAHQNTLEGFPLYIVLMLLGGLRHPVASAVGGLIWIAGRYFYAQGYYTGNPENRMRGGWFHIGELVCLVCTISGALRLLGYI